MRIAILGSAPSSMYMAPFGNPEYKIWACSPGTYASLARCDAFFELHRWQPGEVGKPGSQVPWFSPEYVQWMAMRDPATCPVWMQEAVPAIPASRQLPVDDLLSKYGTFFFTSSIAWMIACAIEDILEARDKGDDSQHTIALFGVDMAAAEEYGYQRAGCQHFLLLAADLGIDIYVPPESDLLRPMPLYGISEGTHWMIKATARRKELDARLAQAQNNLEGFKREVAFLQGALDDLNYHTTTWGEDRDGVGTSHLIMARSPAIQRAVFERVGSPDEEGI